MARSGENVLVGVRENPDFRTGTPHVPQAFGGNRSHLGISSRTLRVSPSATATPLKLLGLLWFPATGFEQNMCAKGPAVFFLHALKILHRRLGALDVILHSGFRKDFVRVVVRTIAGILHINKNTAKCFYGKRKLLHNINSAARFSRRPMFESSTDLPPHMLAAGGVCFANQQVRPGLR